MGGIVPQVTSRGKAYISFHRWLEILIYFEKYF